MKLAHIQTAAGPRAAKVFDDHAVFVESVYPQLPKTIDDLLLAGDEAFVKLQGLGPDMGQRAPLKPELLMAPVLKPRKFLGLGMNYKRHLEEVRKIGIELPPYQYWFNKQVTCINGPYDDVVAPAISDTLDYEVEIALIIGRHAKHVKAKDAMSFIAGFTVCNDLTVREWQRHTPTFTIGKSFDTHGPIGPWLVTPDELSNLEHMTLRCLVNGQVVQESTTEDMIYSYGELIEYLSTAFTLEPGDIIATGTPEGVGSLMTPPRFLAPGDRVRCEVEGIGFIENTVVSE